MSVRLAELSDDPLDLAAHVAAVSDPAHGAIATFMGTVRDHDPSVTGEVTHLDYSAHPDAASSLSRIAEGVALDHPETALAVTHRVGLLAVGDAAIVAVAASAHRAEAFDACRDLVERVKAELPIWKREILADGSHTWVGL
ncbi:molybdenum cofactor biosynthesis protein MoaE [Demequina sp. NBRC 110054]|uniref:molybdenum cofactor biosynthesis protein MoaE n=1 Tax=Demequina sp. NBRC 110054 TaxID=1570343 RepID=UPI0009FC8814|nr:molybdenum cofactor biosynthesis protein MoaE [Demequina sp. NBRC 110054]